MSKRQDIIKARTNRLEAAIANAVDRKLGVDPVLVINLVTGVMPVMIFADEERKIRGHKPIFVTLGFSMQVETVSSHRVGKSRGDEFFELKLVPSEGMLALPFVANDLELEAFVTADPVELVHAYTGREIQRLVKLLNSL